MSSIHDFERYEFAIEIIKIERGLVFQDRMAEEEKPNPSKPLVQYYTNLIKSLTAFERSLLVEDTDTISAIINKDVLKRVSREAVDA
jgi:hypothetical protein